MLILVGNSVSNLNSYNSTKKFKNEKFIKAKSFSGAKCSYIHISPHIKPTIGEFNLDYLILNLKTNKRNSSKTATQMSSALIDYSQSLTIWLTAPKKWQSKQQRTWSERLTYKLAWWMYITFIDHTVTTDLERHWKKSKIHSNKLRAVAFPIISCVFLLKQDWYSAYNSSNISLGNENDWTAFGVSKSLSEKIFI